MDEIDFKKINISKMRNTEKGTEPVREEIIKFINETSKVYDENDELLAIFIKGITSNEMIEIGRGIARHKGWSNSRGAYAGSVKPRIIQSGKYKGRRTIVGNKVRSSVIGYLMPYLVKDPKPQLSKATKKDREYYNTEVKRLYNYYDEFIKQLMPEEYKKQVEYLEPLSDGIKISDTTTNIQVNYDQQAFYHEDKGNKNLYGSITTYYPTGEEYEGGEFVLGDYLTAFKIQEGDFLYVNQSAIHGTLPTTKGVRLSCVGFQSVRLINYYKRLEKKTIEFIDLMIEKHKMNTLKTP